MQIIKKSLNDLKAAKYNPRINLQPGHPEFEKLKRSIETFGYTDPIIWNQRTGNVVGGHQRLKVLKTLGYEEVDVSVVDLDDEKEKAFNIALNRIGGDWEEEVLKALLIELDGEDLELTGFDEEEINELLSEFDDDDVIEEDDDLDKNGNKDTDESKCRIGDVWQLGTHRLIVGDFTGPGKRQQTDDADLIIESWEEETGLQAKLLERTKKK